MYRFTPRKGRGTLERYEMRLDTKDNAKIGRGKWPIATVTDQLTGVRYRVRPAACGLRCFCDAVVTKVFEVTEA